MEERPSGTVTFLFTDIEGSTVLLRQLRDAYGDVLATHGRLLRQAFEDAGGQEIDTQGDSFFVAFSSPKDAVHAAVAAQRSLAEETWPEGAAVNVRMGIHTGDASLAADRYLGLSVHRAARICSAGHGGQILISPDDLRAARGPGGGAARRDAGSRRAAAQGLRPADPALPARRPRPPGVVPAAEDARAHAVRGRRGPARGRGAASIEARAGGEGHGSRPDRGRPGARAGGVPDDPRGGAGHRGRRRGRRRRTRRSTKCAGLVRTSS